MALALPMPVRPSHILKWSSMTRLSPGCAVCGGGITLHDPTEEVELIKAQTPRGNFMSARHTLRNYRRHWYPQIISRDTYDTWQEKGQTIEQICRQKAQDIVAHHCPPQFSAAVEAELEYIVRRYLPDFHFE
ncbi:trimethylamine methyltransferase family protein [Chloroflexota bacterium]